MKQVILIHGLPSKEEVTGDVWPSPSNSHWFPWIQKQLTRRDILCQSLEMPKSYNPIYSEHKRVLDQMEISDETILVGHSCGGGFLIKYLSENKNLKPKKVVLVAPWVDPERFLIELNPDSDYFNFEIDKSLTDRTDLYCMYSTDDEESIINSVSKIKEELPDIKMKIFTNKKHFTEKSLNSKEFPELLELILS
jgi:predicted alpha/beta hydrolase family esterase